MSKAGNGGNVFYFKCSDSDDVGKCNKLQLLSLIRAYALFCRMLLMAAFAATLATPMKHTRVHARVCTRRRAYVHGYTSARTRTNAGTWIARTRTRTCARQMELRGDFLEVRCHMLSGRPDLLRSLQATYFDLKRKKYRLSFIPIFLAKRLATSF